MKSQKTRALRQAQDFIYIAAHREWSGLRMLRQILRSALRVEILLIATSAAAQTSMPVSVVDHGGAAVHGLQKSDFQVRSGKATTFDSIEEVPPLNFTGFAEPVPVFILFDEVSIIRTDQDNISHLLLSYLRRVADEHLAVTLLVNTPSGVQVIHDMSTDPKVFAAAIDRVMTKNGQSPTETPSVTGDDFSKQVGEETAQLRQLTHSVPPIIKWEGYYSRNLRQLEALQAVGRMLQHSRKRKPLVWITGDFPVYVENGDLTTKFDYRGQANTTVQSSSNVAILNSAYQAAVNSLNDARLSLYPVQPWESDEYTRIGLAEIAKKTGGALLGGRWGIEFDTQTADQKGVNDFVSLMAGLREHFDSYYILRLAVQPERRLVWVDFSVKVTRPDTKATAANGFFSIPQ